MRETSLPLLLRGIVKEPVPDLSIRSVVTDSRKVEPGGVFVAIRGEKEDGHAYVAHALANGAVAAVVSRLPSEPGPYYLVEDTKDAYISMAGNYRDTFSIPIAAITGSVGKTTTKEMVAAIFSSFDRTLKNEGNLNNEIGVSETMFTLNDDMRLAVFEIGMDRRGDIRKLAIAVKPSAAIITRIGITHIEHLGSKETILKEKLEIMMGMPDTGILVLNGDDEMLMGAKSALSMRTSSFAIKNKNADVVAEDIFTRRNKTEFQIVDREFGRFDAVIPTVGHHNVSNALSAFLLATRIGLDPKRSANALQNFRNAEMRQHLVEFSGVTVIEDCYNANPDSMRAALSTLASMPVTGIRVAVLGDMLELGDCSQEEHRKLGMEAGQFGVDILLCYGEQMKETARAAKMGRVTDVHHFEDKTLLADYLTKTLRPGDAVVVKGSRSMRMEDVLLMFYRQ